MALPIDDSKPKTFVNLIISGNGLADLDVFSKSDPYCVVFEKISGKKISTSGKVSKDTYEDVQWVERGRTETIMNNLNPQFSKTIRMPYLFEETQLLRFEMYDLDTKNSHVLSNQDFIGRFECSLGEIVSYSTLKAHLQNGSGIGRQWRNGDKPKKCGTITIRAIEDERNEKLQFDVRGEHLDKKDFFGKSDPYLMIWRKFDDGSGHLACQTEVKPKTLDPRWNTVTMNLQLLCGKDYDFPFNIDCYDQDKWSRDDLIGSCRATVNHILGGGHGEPVEIELIKEKQKLKKGAKYKNSGVLVFWNARIYQEPTFLDFITGGTQLDFAVAIDFTASNGAVMNPSSLHFIASDRPTQYELAIRSCLSICQSYNSKKTFEAYGFGAKLSPNSPVSAIFDLDLKNRTPTCIGVQGVMKAYRDTVHNVQLYGPTNFAPIVDKMAGKAANLMSDSSRYQILMIITDGVITDMHNTVRSIISASSLPLSIIIIGVGNEDFEKMHELDSDDRLLQQDSRIAQRDIVQFVTMRQFLNNAAGAYLDPEIVMQNLAREVLQEVPEQLTSYMKMRGFEPRKADDPWPRDSPVPGYTPFFDGMSVAGSFDSNDASNGTRASGPLPPNIGFQVNVASAPSAPPISTNDVVPNYTYGN